MRLVLMHKNAQMLSLQWQGSMAHLIFFFSVKARAIQHLGHPNIFVKYS